MTNQIVVTNMAHLNALQHHIPGELAYVEETKEIYMWDEDKGWQLLQIDNKGIDFNLYDLNKNVINQLPPLTSDEIYNNIEMLNNYHNETNNSYYMFLCRDFNYYTIFNFNPILTGPSFAKSVCEIILELGEVYSIDKLIDGAIEIWIKPNGQEAPYAFYLFPYDAGVVYYG